MILALDLGRFVGWAAGDPGGRPRAATLELPPPLKLEGAGEDYGRIAAAFADHLAGLITVHKPRSIWFEAPMPPSRMRMESIARVLFGLAWTCELIAYRRILPCNEANVTSVRNTVCERREDMKPDDRVNLFCVQQGWTPADTHQADALALWAFACRAEAMRARLRGAA